jgi:hypothetical protein
MGWRWVLYWPAIGCAFGFLILFFLMEETNYDRKTVGVVQAHSSSNSIEGSAVDTEKGNHTARTQDINIVTEYRTKTFWQKLSLVDKKRPNNLLTMFWRPFTFVALPVVLYSGFAYGCTVVWALLNSGTASLILSSPPYNFKASIVGLFSLASLLGCIVG